MLQKRFLIAGGAGFIGNHLVRRFLSYKWVKKIVVVDNFSTGSINNLEDKMTDPRLEIIDCDISKDLPKLSDFDVIFHLAAIANPTQYEENPIDTLLVNSEGNKNLLDIANESNSNYIFFSSSEVYGNHNEIPKEGMIEEIESHLTLNQKRSPYFIGKSFGEELVRNICAKEHINYLIIRPFNIYGPKMDRNSNYGRVIPNFINWAVNKQQLRIHGDGTQERSFCYIDDFNDAIISLLKYPFPSKRVVNIGNPDPITIIQLAKIINERLDNTAGYIFTDRYEYEPKYRTPNIDRIFNLTGWKPKISLKEGIERTIKFCMEDKEYGNFEQIQSIDSSTHIFST